MRCLAYTTASLVEPGPEDGAHEETEKTNSDKVQVSWDLIFKYFSDIWHFSSATPANSIVYHTPVTCNSQ